MCVICDPYLYSNEKHFNFLSHTKYVSVGGNIKIVNITEISEYIIKINVNDIVNLGYYQFTILLTRTHKTKLKCSNFGRFYFKN